MKFHLTFPVNARHSALKRADIWEDGFIFVCKLMEHHVVFLGPFYPFGCFTTKIFGYRSRRCQSPKAPTLRQKSQKYSYGYVRQKTRDAITRFWKQEKELS